MTRTRNWESAANDCRALEAPVRQFAWNAFMILQGDVANHRFIVICIDLVELLSLCASAVSSAVQHCRLNRDMLRNQVFRSSAVNRTLFQRELERLSTRGEEVVLKLFRCVERVSWCLLDHGSVGWSTANLSSRFPTDFDRDDACYWRYNPN